MKNRIISKNDIDFNSRINMITTAGYREKELMKNADKIYSTNNGRCIEFHNSKTGRYCQYDKISKNWTN